MTKTYEQAIREGLNEMHEQREMLSESKWDLNQGNAKDNPKPPYKALFDNGRGTLSFGWVDEEGFVTDVTMDQWQKLTYPAKKQDMYVRDITTKLLMSIKQFNKKIDFNTWCKQNKDAHFVDVFREMQKYGAKKIPKSGIKVY